ncbi:hypothetical protein C8F04DRAFT_1195717 [Mycena alexandri]|uniref:Uncharacterized protein n=1 Tax=Mycena alexandri TaxID=1745969 RepID=A0AAD6S6Q8_9AGAR|nr:hypothetical protein C8F04DRAFT_1195717 [Mycena alexandri]
MKGFDVESTSLGTLRGIRNLRNVSNTHVVGGPELEMRSIETRYGKCRRDPRCRQEHNIPAMRVRTARGAGRENHHTRDAREACARRRRREYARGAGGESIRAAREAERACARRGEQRERAHGAGREITITLAMRGRRARGAGGKSMRAARGGESVRAARKEGARNSGNK